MNNEAVANVIENQVKAFGTGMNYARYRFYEKAGPRISTILSSDREDGLGDLFKAYIPSEREVQ